jgi:hypothetical protein
MVAPQSGPWDAATTRASYSSASSSVNRGLPELIMLSRAGVEGRDPPLDCTAAKATRDARAFTSIAWPAVGEK